MEDLTVKTIMEFGVTMIVVLLFFWQYLRLEKFSMEREHKLYETINIVTSQIPEIKELLVKIEEKINNKIKD